MSQLRGQPLFVRLPQGWSPFPKQRKTKEEEPEIIDSKFKIGDRVEFIKNWNYPIPFCETVCPDCMRAWKGTKATILGAYKQDNRYEYAANVDGCGETGMIREEFLQKSTGIGNIFQKYWFVLILAIIVLYFVFKK